MMESIGSFTKEVLQALRGIGHYKSLFAVITSIIALTVGTSGLIFGLVRGVLLYPLPFPQPKDVVMIWEENPQQGFLRNTVSWPNFEDWRREADSFAALAAWKHETDVLTNLGEPERLVGATVTADFFTVLGVQPFLGHTFSAEEEKSRAPVVLISEGLWRRRFGASRSALGSSILLDGNPFVVIGVMPEGFDRPLATLFNKSDFWRPMTVKPSRGVRFLLVVGRVSSDVVTAKAELTHIANQLEDRHPENKGWTASVFSLHDEIVRTVRPVLQILLIAACMVLLIGCTNLANILLTRAANREHEIALRLSLGATRRRLFSLFTAESLVLVLPGSLLGALLTRMGGRILTRDYFQFLPRLEEIDLGRPILQFTLFLAAVITLATSILVTVQASKSDLGKHLAEGGRGASSSRGSRRIREALAVLQVVFTFPLLVSTILLMKSVQRLEQIDLGFTPSNVFAGEIVLPDSRYGEPRAQGEFYRVLIENLGGDPGIAACSAISDLPLSEWSTGMEFVPVGMQFSPREKSPFAQFRIVAPDYFTTMEVRRLRGRDFDDNDRSNTEPVFIVSRELALRFFHTKEPLGERLSVSYSGRPIEGRIIGVVDDVRHKGPEDEVEPTIYASYLQFPSRRMTILVRAKDGSEMSTTLRNTMKRLDSGLPPPGLASMEHLYRLAIAGSRLRTLVLGVFGGLALALATLGIYGVVSYSTALRRHEIGIRMALGAKRTEILLMILQHGMILSLWGVLGGAILELGASRFLVSYLYGVSAMDISIWVAIAVLLVLIGALASLESASKAADLTPALVLKGE